MTTRLRQPGWDPLNRDRLERLLATSSPDDAPYAVVDWDNTSIFRDIEDAVLAHQLERLDFAIPASRWREVITANLDVEALTRGMRQGRGQRVELDALLDDLEELYDWHWARSETMGGDQPAAALLAADEHLALRAKLRHLYHAIDAHLGHTTSCVWVTRLFAGMTPQRVHALTRKAVRAQRARPVTTTTWTCPEALPGRAGVVAASWGDGLRVLPEMQELYHALREVGVEVYVCSASFVEIVREVASHPEHGYALDPERVFGMQLERDASGAFTHHPVADAPPTQAEGKSETIRRFIAARHGRGPALVAGDSDGDADMMCAFEDTAVRLVINRVKPGLIGALARRAVAQRGADTADTLLQGRDEHRGLMRPSPASLLAGERKPRLLADSEQD